TPTQPVSPAYYAFTVDNITPTFTGRFGNNSSTMFGYRVKGQWNLLSLPLTVDNPLKTAVYPASTSSAFAYSDHYYILDTIRGGLGYWLKFPSTETIWITGNPVASDTISLLAGWNLIGSVKDSIPLSTLTTL